MDNVLITILGLIRGGLIGLLLLDLTIGEVVASNVVFILGYGLRMLHEQSDIKRKKNY